MSTNGETIGTRVFQNEDQVLFAQISHDFNPMHVDPVAARRLISGQQVVHGIHLLLSALEFWLPNLASPLKMVTCNFKNPVSVGDRVHFNQTDIDTNQSMVEGTVNGLVCLIVTLSCSSKNSATAVANAKSGYATTNLQNSLLLETLRKPFDEGPDFHRGRRYTIPLNSSGHAANFPRSFILLGKARLSATIALSYIVGMVCPGLHSVFSSTYIELETDAKNTDSLYLSIGKYDHRFRLFDLTFDGPIRGTIKAFSRPPPQLQPTVKDLQKILTPLEFKGTLSLIIGASRGLGELTAKILAAGAGDTVITYSSGLDDVNAIHDEIRQQTQSKCRTMRLNLNQDDFHSVNLDWTQFTSIYYFATPRIFRKKALVFEASLFQEFFKIYIEKFYELCACVEESTRTTKVKIYFPSTIALEERPKGMTEYAMAKSAAEVLTHEINRTFTKVSVLSTRLPRLSTDQTATILNIPAESNIETLLPIIRKLSG